MVGGNRDNSRLRGLVPGKELVGKATYVWLNWDPHRTGGPIRSRIGTNSR